ncbi:MAG: hypothetical protein ACI97N_001938 [Cognaticolwellia sp.]|jgi:hypothetical protein|tara:strand:+ start:353 stop:910 length:558 start_codon:yes stop_codon:yes gene_type:complete
MTTKEFLNVLEQHQDLPLLFEYKKGAFTRMDYHLTEVKNVSYDTVDCGGLQNTWQEVHVQLWENEIPEPNHRVDTTKALKIFQTIQKVRPTLTDVAIKFEYGNDSFHTAVLPVGTMEIYDNQIIVKLGKEETTCKAKDRATTPEEKAIACCAPADVVQIKKKPMVDLLNLVNSKEESCAPGSGCC